MPPNGALVGDMFVKFTADNISCMHTAADVNFNDKNQQANILSYT
jgi:hypothetical protein